MAISGAKKTVLQTVGLVVFMGGLAWASVPFYDWFCRVTGFGGTTGVSEVASDEILEQTIKVRFDASLERNMPWQFTPMAREMELRIGETGSGILRSVQPYRQARCRVRELQCRSLFRGRLFHQD